MLRARIVRDVAELEALVPAWRALLGRAAHAEPVLTPLWLLAWWRVFGDADGRALQAVAVEEGGDLVALVPLARRLAAHRRAIPTRRLELLASGEDEADEIGSDYVGALVASGREAEVAEIVAQALGRRALVDDWDELRMPAMNGEDAFVPALAARLGDEGCVVSVDAYAQCPHVPLPSSWDDYLRALGSSRRYVVVRSLRALEAWAGPGGWERRVARTPEELTEGVRILHDLHAERWTAAGRSGVFASRRFARFHDEVMPRMLAGEDGTSLELSWLSVHGRPIAAAYNVVYREKVYFYQSGRSVDVPKGVRPGIALHALALRASIEAGRREYDFLAGTSRYKCDLGLAMRPLVTLRAVAPSLRARAVEVVRSMTERAIAGVRAAARRTQPASATPAGTQEPASE
jgi:CelD/BcsL family acetyltransferase involved in cellulose biosynthesis